MARVEDDALLEAMVRDAIATYGQHTGSVGGLGLGFVDRVLELEALPLDSFAHCFTGAPFIQKNKLPAGCRLRHFVYVVPIVDSGDAQQRLRVGRNGEDLDIALFFRPTSNCERTYVAMPEQAFLADGGEVQYAFRVRNFFEHRDGAVELRDDLAFGMEFTSSTHARNPRRGVMLVTNKQLFSFQLGEMGAMQAGFKMQYHLSTTAHAPVCAEAQAVLHTQAFGRVVLPPSQEECMARALAAHFNECQRWRSKGAATRSSGGLAHAKLLAGDMRHFDVSVSSAVPIAHRASARLCFVVGDVERTPSAEAYSAQAVAVDAQPAPLERTVSAPPASSDGFDESLRFIAAMRARASASGVAAEQLKQAAADLFPWPLRGGTAAVAVGVRAHADKDDEEGEAVGELSRADAQRVYQVDAGPLLRVRVTNMSLNDAMVTLRPVYFEASAASDENENDVVELKPCETWELPYPLQMEEGENANGWLLQDGAGHTVLTLVFVLSAASLAEFQDARARAARLQDAETEADIAMFFDTLSADYPEPAMATGAHDVLMQGVPAADTPPATGMDALTLDCCICLDAKPVKQMAVFVPCGHIKCCSVCFAMQARADAAARRPSKCPTCRAHVNNAMKVFF